MPVMCIWEHDVWILDIAMPQLIIEGNTVYGSCYGVLLGYAAIKVPNPLNTLT
jgi:hypothetical protein